MDNINILNFENMPLYIVDGKIRNAIILFNLSFNEAINIDERVQKFLNPESKLKSIKSSSLTTINYNDKEYLLILAYRKNEIEDKFFIDYYNVQEFYQLLGYSFNERKNCYELVCQMQMPRISVIALLGCDEELLKSIIKF